jgi:hypothetical protein
VTKIKEKVAQLGAGGGRCLFSGTLGMVDWDARVMPESEMNLSKLRLAAENMDECKNISIMMGIVVVSAEDFGDTDNFPSKLQRVHNDHNIDMAALTLFWGDKLTRPWAHLIMHRFTVGIYTED